MRPAEFVLRLLPLTTLLAWWGCGHPQNIPASRDQERSHIIRHQDEVFAQSSLWKPRATNWESPAAALAPLFLEERIQTNSSPHSSPAPFGTVSDEKVDRTRPAVYAQAGPVDLPGGITTEICYVWPGRRPAARDQNPILQGLRILLNQAGQPILWEELREGARLRQLFVARSVEQAAALQFGPPLPGRNHSVEGRVAEEAGVVLARILEDGPVPMGPVIYLAAAHGVLRTVLCRCMPAQVRNVVATPEYELLPMEDLLMSLEPGPGTLGRRTARLLGQRLSRAELEACLRLP